MHFPRGADYLLHLTQSLHSFWGFNWEVVPGWPPAALPRRMTMYAGMATAPETYRCLKWVPVLEAL